MSVLTCTKYLNFIAAECDRHLADGEVTVDKLLALKIELSRFLKQIEKSDISAEIKSKIMDLRIDCISSKIEIDIGLVLIWIIYFGVWAYLSEYRIQEKRKFALLDLKGQVSGLSSFILLDT